MHFCTFWKLKFIKSTEFRAPKMVKMTFLALLDSAKLISRKIWMIWKILKCQHCETFRSLVSIKYLELRVKTVFLGWALFFWLPPRPLAAPLTGFLRIAAAFLAAASAVVMNVLLLSFWWPLFRILEEVEVGDRSSSDSLALVSENIRLYATLPVGSGVGTVAFLRYGLSFRIVALFSDTSPLNLKYVKN